MTIIEADSVSSKPHRVDSLQIFAGQRYSFVVSTFLAKAEHLILTSLAQLKADQPIDNYWIRANPHGEGNFTNGINSAILRYEGAPAADPDVTKPPVLVNQLCEQDLTPFTPMPVVRDFDMPEGVQLRL